MSDGLSEGLKELQESLSSSEPDEVPSEDSQIDSQIETIDSAVDETSVPEPEPPVDQPEGWNPTDRTEPSPEFPTAEDELSAADQPLPIDHPHASDIGDWPNPDEFEVPEPDLDLASLSQADFEEAVFPAEDEDDHEAGQKTLARVQANLTSAGYATDEPWRTQIAAALWGRRTYQHGSVSDVRRSVERAPVAEIIACMPDGGDDTVNRMRAEIRAELAAEQAAELEIMASEGLETGGRTGMAVVGVASFLAIGLPLLFARRG